MDLIAASRYHLASLEARAASPDTIRNYGMIERRFITYLADVCRTGPRLGELTVERTRGYLVWLKDVHRAKRWGGTTVGHSAADLAYHAQLLKTWGGFLAREFEESFPQGNPLRKLQVQR